MTLVFLTAEQLVDYPFCYYWIFFFFLSQAVGRELLLHFADYMLSNYGHLANVSEFMNMTVLHILPSLNPDGFEASEEGDCESQQGR